MSTCCIFSQDLQSRHFNFSFLDQKSDADATN